MNHNNDGIHSADPKTPTGKRQTKPKDSATKSSKKKQRMNYEQAVSPYTVPPSMKSAGEILMRARCVLFCFGLVWFGLVWFGLECRVSFELLFDFDSTQFHGGTYFIHFICIDVQMEYTSNFLNRS